MLKQSLSGKKQEGVQFDWMDVSIPALLVWVVDKV